MSAAPEQTQQKKNPAQSPRVQKKLEKKNDLQKTGPAPTRVEPVAAKYMSIIQKEIDERNAQEKVPKKQVHVIPDDPPRGRQKVQDCINYLPLSTPYHDFNTKGINSNSTPYSARSTATSKSCKRNMQQISMENTAAGPIKCSGGSSN
eukprot:15333561-Ditylum_brightwellii.AAC.1